MTLQNVVGLPEYKNYIKYTGFGVYKRRRGAIYSTKQN